MTELGRADSEVRYARVSAGARSLAAEAANLGRGDISFGVAALCIILVGIALRPGIVSMGPLLPLVRDEFDLSNVTASLLIAIPDLLMGALALPAPWLARRYGRDRVIPAALLMLAVATATRAFATSTAVLLVTTAGVGAGIAITGALIAGFVKAGFPTRAALMMSLYATALALGSTTSAAASGPIAQVVGGWRFGSGVWSLLGLSAIAAWLLMGRRGRLGARKQVPIGRHDLPLRNRKAWLIALFFGCINFLFYALLSWAVPIYLERGLSATEAGLVLATFIGGSMVATPVFGVLSRSEDRRPLLAVSAGLVVAGLVSIATLPAAGVYLPALLIGFGVAGGFTLGMTLPLDNTRDADEASAWTAFVLTVGYLIAATGPLITGALRDLTGGFETPIWFLSFVGVALLFLTPFLNPPTSDSSDQVGDLSTPDYTLTGLKLGA